MGSIALGLGAGLWAGEELRLIRAGDLRRQVHQVHARVRTQPLAKTAQPGVVTCAHSGIIWRPALRPRFSLDGVAEVVEKIAVEKPLQDISIIRHGSC